MKSYEVKGTFERNYKTGVFTKSVDAENENRAREKILSLIGSKQKIKRSKIIIEGIKEAK